MADNVMADNQKLSCCKCGCFEFEYDSYWEEYLCKECGWIVEDQMKISELNRIRISHSQKKNEKQKKREQYPGEKKINKKNIEVLRGKKPSTALRLCSHCNSQFYEPKTKTDKTDFNAMQKVRVGCSICGAPVCFSCSANAADERGKGGNCLCPNCGKELGSAGEAGELGKYFNGWDQVKSKNKNDEIFTATLAGDVGRVRALCEEGADVDDRNEQGWTPLMVAASEGDMTIADALLSRGADVNLQSKKGESSLMLASRWGHSKLFRMLLIDAEANFNLKNNDGKTALTIAQENKHTEIANLIESYANRNRKENKDEK